MPLKLNSSGGGSVTVQEPSTASNVTFNLPSETATAIYSNASGNVGIGTSSPDSLSNFRFLDVGSSGTNQGVVQVNNGTVKTAIYANSTDGYLATRTNHNLNIQTNGTTRATIDTSGNLLVGTTTSSGKLTVFDSATTSAGTRIFAVSDNNGRYSGFYAGADGTGFNAANTVLGVRSTTGTGRSINASGTVNASGADYAEYMLKSGDFTIAKGDICGINSEGKLTNVFAEAVTFVVKSTNPSYVGGDTWGVGIEDLETLEIARQAVDRIAFAGQVPVNVLGTTSGQYIIPVNENGVIKGEAVGNPTFEQYQIAVGKVIAIEADGRARIIVKVA